ncbi:class I SAM-dependent methyltransferase [Alkalilimnicola ehrlichii MLHE-1]|uniref:Methyltransferase type 12 n=1 Tax=Alkalilimnicola ehrlichii (strain ATCC BAA-1101 / DSM 17681 / MLHE-1) TaxID=187272 RepID=Q0AAX1_ALKEH|nr:class I SAM-dependent methyltransferase [Alkalilimnicola ehrlichii]ABI56016.1 Methyltransferase type 12 [Alkalilimnicola ehrlichii MLHE-1]
MVSDRAPAGGDSWRRQGWDQRYRQAEPGSAAAVLADNLHLLPPRGRALDLACGLGSNAMLLAGAGLETEAWDYSPVALERLMERARRQGLAITPRERDVEQHPPPAVSFDVIVVAHFLHRPTAPDLFRALRPGGVLFYQTWSRARVSDAGPSNPAFRLAEGELLTLFAGLRPLLYREEGDQGDTTQGLRDVACLVARKPA